MQYLFQFVYKRQIARVKGLKKPWPGHVIVTMSLTLTLSMIIDIAPATRLQQLLVKLLVKTKFCETLSNLGHRHLN